MTEFQEVMKEWKRMCAWCKKHPVAGYCGGHCKTGCGINKPYTALIMAADKPEEFEEHVMSWAAEHPEQVYPTWWKYMCMIGVIPDKLGDKTLGEMTVYSLMNTHIQSDLAQRLGLAPKEG